MIALCRAYANRQQIEVVATSKIGSPGASTFGRDGLMQLMDAARQRFSTLATTSICCRLA